MTVLPEPTALATPVKGSNSKTPSPPVFQLPGCSEKEKIDIFYNNSILSL